MSRTKKDIINDVSEELDINITRFNPLKSEWADILAEIRKLKADKERLKAQNF